MTWKVRGSIKVRLVQSSPTDSEDTDTAVWLHFGWVRGIDTDEDNAGASILAALSPVTDGLFRVDLEPADILEAALDWEAEE